MATLGIKLFLVVLCTVFLAVHGQSMSGQTETVQITPNITSEVCAEIHLCQHLGCDTHWNQNSACQCDWACGLFDDCCVDFAATCSDETVPDVLGGLDRSSFECMTNLVNNKSPLLKKTNHHWMLSHCPEITEATHVVQQNCETPTSENPTTLIPVTDTDGVTFKNAYCALCHGRPTYKLVPWTLNASCQKSVIDRLQNTNRATYQRIVWNNCSHSFQLPSILSSGPITRRPCLPSLVTDCGSDGTTGRLIAQTCQRFTAIIRSEQSKMLYRNPECFATCEVSDSRYTLSCPTQSFYLSGQYAVAMPQVDTLTTQQLNVQVDHSDILLSVAFKPARRPSSALIPEPVPGPVLTPLSIILDFDQDNGDSQDTVCEDGDLYDSTTQECLSPSCGPGFTFVTSEGKCELTNSLADTASERFHCLEKHYQQRLNFSLVVTVETANMSGRNRSAFSNEPFVSTTERCIEDSLRAMDEGRHGVTPGLSVLKLLNSSKMFFEITFQRHDEDIEILSSNDTGIDDIVFWQNLVDSVVEDIEKWLLASPDPGGRSCGIENVQIVQKCGSDILSEFSMTGDCQETLWLPLNENTTIGTDNQTVLVFNEDTESWFNVSSYLLRIRFYQEESLLNISSPEIGLCRESAIAFTCPTVELQESQFSPVEESPRNGSLVFDETGTILSPDEFVRTDQGRIKVCSTLLPTGTGRSPFFNFDYVQAVLSTVGLSISVFAGSITLITYVAFPSLHCRTRNAIIGMVASLIAAQVLLLTSGHAVANNKACTALAVAGHFLWMSSLTWTNVLAFLLWYTFAGGKPAPSGGQAPFRSKTNLFGITYAFGVPLAVVIPCLIIHFCSCTEIGVIYSTDRACWITSGLVNLVAFGVPMAVFLVINILLFARTVWAIRSSRRRSEQQLHKKREKKLRRTRKELMIYIRIASLMGFTWVFGFVSSAFPKVEALAYLFIILNSLQGLFIFLSFTFNVQVWKRWQKKLSPVGSAIWSKASLATSKMSRSSVIASSVSAGVAASESVEMSSNLGCESATHGDVEHKGQARKAGKFKVTLSGIWAKKLVHQGPQSEDDEANTKFQDGSVDVDECNNTVDGEQKGQARQAGWSKANLSDIWAKKLGHRGHQSDDDEAKSKFQDGSVDVDKCNNSQMKASWLKARLSGIWAKRLHPSQEDPTSKTASFNNQYGGDTTRMGAVETAKSIPHGKCLLLPSPQQSKDVETPKGSLNRGMPEDLQIGAPCRSRPLTPISKSKPHQQPEELAGADVVAPDQVSFQGMAASKKDVRGILTCEGQSCRKPLPPIPSSKPCQQPEEPTGTDEQQDQVSFQGMAASKEDARCILTCEGMSCGKPLPPTPLPKPQHQAEDLHGTNVVVAQVSCQGVAASYVNYFLRSEGPSCGKPLPPTPSPKTQYQAEDIQGANVVVAQNSCSGMNASCEDDRNILGEGSSSGKPVPPPKPQHQVSSSDMSASKNDTQDTLGSKDSSCLNLKKTGNPVGQGNISAIVPSLASQYFQDQHQPIEHPPRKPTLPPKPVN